MQRCLSHILSIVRISRVPSFLRKSAHIANSCPPISVAQIRVYRETSWCQRRSTSRAPMRRITTDKSVPQGAFLMILQNRHIPGAMSGLKVNDRSLNAQPPLSLFSTSFWVSSTQKPHSSVTSSVIGSDELDAPSRRRGDGNAIGAICGVSYWRACLVTTDVGQRQEWLLLSAQINGVNERLGRRG